MLLIASDLHLGDGTTANSISQNAFQLFAGRLQETAEFASVRRDGSYRPIDSIDVVLLGDILDPLHSTLWLDTQPGDTNYIRPWSDQSNPQYAPKLLQVTRAIIEQNKGSLEVLRRCARGEIVTLAPATKKGNPDRRTKSRIPLRVRFHYMVGNHDWYYHLKGPAFDAIRREIIDAIGLCNSESPFAFELEEDPQLKDLLAPYQLFVRHGDCFDKFNYDADLGRDHSALGDVFTMDVCNRFPVEVDKQYHGQLPAGLVDSLRRISNIRPALAAPLWISSQIRSHIEDPALQNELKQVWDRIADEFLQLDYVRQLDKAFQFDLVDAMQLMIKISGGASIETIDDVVIWVRNQMWAGERSFANHALQESAFLNQTALYVVYGHTHHYEVVPLDDNLNMQSQLYFNSGTWHPYYDLAIKNIKAQKFVPYQAMTYLVFYSGDEYDGRHFETWSGGYA